MGLFTRQKKPLLLSGSTPRKQGRQKWLARLRFVLVALVAVSLVYGAVLSGRRKAAYRTARVETERIQLASRRFRQDMGRCPHDAVELAHPPAGGVPYLAREPVDPWGNPYHYNCPGRWDADDVDVASAGPDGAWDGGDDITTDL